MSLLINEDFEGGGTPAFWVGLGGANFDYSASPLAGSESLHVDGSGAGQQAFYPSGNALNHSEIWFKCLLRVDTLPGSSDVVMNIEDSSYNMGYRLVLNSTGTLLVYDSAGAGVYSTTVDAVSAGTIYSLWGHYKKGSGVNAILTVAFDVAGNARPSAGNKFAGGTTGVSTQQAEQFHLICTTGAIVTWDDVQFADTDVFATVTVTVSLTGVGASPAVGAFQINGNFSVAGVAASPAIGTGTVNTDLPVTVTVNLTGVAATPSIGIGTVVIEGEVITPPVEDLVPGRMWYGLPEDEKVYLTGVAANPQVGRITPVGSPTWEEIEKMFPFPEA